MNFREAIGEVIREQRLANGLQLRDVSERGHLSYSFLSEVERGVKEASSMILENIANGLGVNTYDLIIEAGYRMAGDSLAIPDNLEVFFLRDSRWANQYADLK
jgi:transcriptional regulator with XRE-family HTH domain